jgi:2',3'-cyclic-nucleotide 2'-phosphodiesterase (5'-nucleotidase family)
MTRSPLHEGRSRRSVAVALVVSLLATLFAMSATSSTAAAKRPPKPPKVDFWLTILHNNDGESQLVDLGGGFLEDFGGAARFKTVVDDLKKDAVTGRPWSPGAKRGVMMVSSGDNFLAGPEFNAGLDRGIPFYDTIALDLIGYDAIAIGNHDFDFGPDVLADFLSGFSLTEPPYLSSNLDFSAEPVLQAYVDRGRIAKSAIVRERGERIGVIGATTPALASISSPRNVVVNAVAPAVQAEVTKLERRGVNKIILISHLQSIFEDIDLAAQLTGIDVVIAGGGDELLANDDDLLIPTDDAGTRPVPFASYPLIATDGSGADVPIVTTQGNYGYVGNLVVGFDRSGEVIVVEEERSRPVRVVTDDCGGTLPCDDAVAPDPTMQTRVIDPLVADLEALANNEIATSAVDLDGLRASVRTKETNQGNLIADSLLWQAQQVAADFGVDSPVVGIQNAGGIRNDTVIPAGALTELDTFDMVPFSNFVTVVEDVPRAQFKEILENAYSRVEFTDGRFAQVAGMKVTYDAACVGQVIDGTTGVVTTAGTRVRDVVLDDGTVIVENGVVQPGDPIDVATIDFLAKGGDQYPYRGLPFTTVGFTYQQALSNYLVDGLGGMVTAAEYPVGGEGRITRLN